MDQYLWAPTAMPVLMYRFKDSPQGIQDLIADRFADDWVAIIPPNMPTPDFIDGPHFTNVEKFQGSDGMVIAIWSYET